MKKFHNATRRSLKVSLKTRGFPTLPRGKFGYIVEVNIEPEFDVRKTSVWCRPHLYLLVG